MTPGTSGRFSLDHSDGGLCRRDLSSSDVDVSCNRKPPPGLSRREGHILARRAQLIRATPYAVTGCNEYDSLATMTPSPKDVVAAVPRSGTPERSSALSAAAPAGGDAEPPEPRGPAGRASARRLLAAAAAVLAVALLFVAYLQVSRTYPENSDESNDLLMAWDMLHGNVLLHGWYLSDVSFITTELPQYLMLERLFGLHTDTAHIAAAMTYTLVVVLAVLLARGRVGQDQKSRREAAPRMLLTAGLMFAPQLGVGVFVLLLSLGHIGTAVPLLLTWLVIDRAGPGGSPGTPRFPSGGSHPPGPPLGGTHPPDPPWASPGRRRAAADVGAGRRPAGARGGDHPAGGGVRDARRPRALPRPAAGRPRDGRGPACARAGTSCPWPWRPSSPRAWPRWSAGCSGPAGASSCTRCPISWRRCIPGPSTPG